MNESRKAGVETSVSESKVDSRKVVFFSIYSRSCWSLLLCLCDSATIKSEICTEIKIEILNAIIGRVLRTASTIRALRNAFASSYRRPFAMKLSNRCLVPSHPHNESIENERNARSSPNSESKQPYRSCPPSSDHLTAEFCLLK